MQGISIGISLFFLGLIFFTWDAREMKTNLGKSVVVNKDTLTIVDYSTFSETYTLSNGNELRKDFAESLIIN